MNIGKLNYNRVNYRIEVGTESFGWVMIKEYPYFNLWEKMTKSGIKIKTSFVKSIKLNVVELFIWKMYTVDL